MIIEDVIDSLDKYSVTSKLNIYRGLRSLFIKFNENLFQKLTENIHNILLKYRNNGEIIKLKISDGVFIDMGIKTLKVLEGYIWEYYDYQKYTHYYIRLLHLSDGEKWIALYIDENPLSPWWSEEDRG